MQLDILTIKGEQTGRKVELPDDVFGIEPNDHAIYLAVKQYLAALRQGTHKVKTRSEVKGSSRKLHKQKGTGGSRKGNIRNPLYKGGGSIFGPVPHKYVLKVNRRVKDLAKCSALAYKAKNSAILVMENLSLESPKTKNVVDLMKGLKVEHKKSVLVLPENNANVFLSSRNIPNFDTALIDEINTYQIMNADVLVFTEEAVKLFSEESEGAEPVSVSEN